MHGLLDIQKLGELVAQDSKSESADQALNKQLFALLSISLSGRALEVIMPIRKGDGVAAWKRLKEVYSSKLGPRIHTLYMELFARKWKPGDSVESFTQDILRIQRALTDIGTDTAPQEIVIRNCILSQLPHAQYGPAIQGQLSKSPMNSVQDMIHELKLYEATIKCQDHGEKLDAAFAAGELSKTVVPRKWCDYCKSRTHDGGDSLSNPANKKEEPSRRGQGRGHGRGRGRWRSPGRGRG